jgi:CRISPR-associated protein Csb1
MIDYSLLKQTPRILFEAQLASAQGDRFQPTGFADIGAAEYTRPDVDGTSGVQMLLVESAQSVANRLEKTCLDGDGPGIDAELTGLPYLLARLEGATSEPLLTSSLVEPHRLASPYFLRSEFKETLSSEMAYTGKGPLNWKRIYGVLFKYDPNCLIHGVFLSLLGDGRVRVARALSGFIEAENAKQVVSGGVKNSPVDPKGEIQVEGKEHESGVYSNVPYSRTEYVAEKITAFFNLDLGQIRSYDLGDAGTRLLTALALLKVRRFLASDLRLRTACNLVLKGEVSATAPKGVSLPEESELLGEVKNLIAQCKQQFSDPAVTEWRIPVKVVQAKSKSSPKNKPVEEPGDDTN